MILKKVFKIVVSLFAIVGFVLVGGFFAVNMGITDTKGVIDRQNEYFQTSNKEEFSWTYSTEWGTFKEAVFKDSDTIMRAGKDADISPRLVASILAVEQLRLYHTNRALFESVFAPLKLLGDQIQFSWGVMGIKQDTAIQIEKNLKDKSSQFYLGEKYKNILDFETKEHDKERFERLIREDNRYYSYLYAGLFLKQTEAQWIRAGFDISEKPEILSTLFNIGFKNSKPKANPSAGGSAININGEVYSFGALSAEIYHSDELKEIFPD